MITLSAIGTLSKQPGLPRYIGGVSEPQYKDFAARAQHAGMVCTGARCSLDGLYHRPPRFFLSFLACPSEVSQSSQ